MNSYKEIKPNVFQITEKQLTFEIDTNIEVLDLELYKVVIDDSEHKVFIYHASLIDTYGDYFTTEQLDKINTINNKPHKNITKYITEMISFLNEEYLEDELCLTKKEAIKRATELAKQDGYTVEEQISNETDEVLYIGKSWVENIQDNNLINKPIIEKIIKLKKLNNLLEAFDSFKEVS